jgi:hypothetical protein
MSSIVVALQTAEGRPVPASWFIHIQTLAQPGAHCLNNLLWLLGAVARFSPQLRRICQIRPLSPNSYNNYTVN